MGQRTVTAHRPFPRRPLPAIAAYGFATVMFVAAAGATGVLSSLGNMVASPPLLLTVLIVAWVAGFGPALLVVVLSAVVLDYAFLPPHGSFALGARGVISVASFIIIGVVLARLVAGRRSIEDARRESLEREQVARAEIERVMDRLRHVQAIVDTTLPQVGVPDVVCALVEPLRASLKADTATVLLLSDDGTTVRPVASVGLRENVEETVAVPLGRGVAGRIAVSETGLVFDDLSHEEVVSPFLQHGVKSLVGVPLRAGDRLVGVLHVGSAVFRRFGDDDLVLLRLVAGRVALAIERAGLMDAERAARTAAEVANRQRDVFIAVLSHEMRNRLSAIFTAVQVLDRVGAQSEAAVSSREIIGRQTRYLARLIDDLLDIGRAMAGTSLNRQAIDLGEHVQRCLGEFASTGRLTKHVFRMDARSVHVEADPVRVEQIVSNLVENALKYTPEGGAIEVLVGREADHGVVRVRDSGVGIPADALPMIFDLFSRAEAARRTGEGLGIGLAVVRSLVEAHGGTVEAASDGPGCGSTFTVRLPRIDAPDSLDHRRAAAAA